MHNEANGCPTQIGPPARRLGRHGGQAESYRWQETIVSAVTVGLPAAHGGFVVSSGPDDRDSHRSPRNEGQVSPDRSRSWVS
jgi:hypothetical protein